MANRNYSTDLTDDEICPDEKYVRKFVKQMLQTRIFLGHYQEKRFVDNMHTYRDVIVIADSEKQLKSDVVVVRKKLKELYRNDRWIGITTADVVGTPHGDCFWIESQDVAFGSYWYTIKSVKYFENEVLVRLKVVRAMNDNDLNEPTDVTQQTTTELINNFQNHLIEKIVPLWQDFIKLVTYNNIRQAVTFVSVLFVTAVALFFKGIGYIMDFTLKFMHEFSFFVQSSTPFLIAVVNMVGKIIGGFYILIAMLFKSNNSPPTNVRYAPRAIEYREYPYRSQNSGPIITEIH